MYKFFSEKTEQLIRAFINKTVGAQLSSKDFPGGLPVSISRDLLPRLSGINECTHLEYALSFKADGERMYLGFICLEGEFLSFLMDRRGYLTKIDLPLYAILYEGTLLDVELINKTTFLIFDCACIHGNQCMKSFYPDRLELARHLLQTCLNDPEHLSTHEIAVEHTSIMYPSTLPDIILNTGKWKMKVKTLFYASTIRDVPLAWIYPDDGFIWTLTTAPFHVFHDHSLNVLKWKPVNRISIDFRVTKTLCPDLLFLPSIEKISNLTDCDGKYRQVETAMTHRLETDYKGTPIWFAGIHATGLVNGIYECSWDHRTHTWMILQERKDKRFPNSIYTVLKTIDNLDEAITRTDLHKLN